MDVLLQNLRYASRQLVRDPVFSAVAVVTVALGIGATTVIFSLANALLFRPLPVHEPETLIGFAELEEGRSPRSNYSYPHMQDYRAGAAAVARLAAFGIGDVALSIDGDDATSVLGGFVTHDFFEILGLRPAIGRFFAPDEETPGDPRPVVVLGHDLWQRSFAGSPGAIGETVRVNGQPLTIVGVAPRGFHGLLTGLPMDLWVPIPLYASLNPGSDIDHPTGHLWLEPVARLAPGVSMAQAEAVIGEVGRRIEPRWEDRTISGVQVSRLSGIPLEGRTPLRLFMGLLFATAALVLLIACVNVAGMLLARGTARHRELGIRRALGAGRGRLVGQLLTETALVFVLGGAGALILASWISGLLVAFQPSLPVPVRLDLALDARVVTFALAVSLATGLIFGLTPALRASRPDIVSGLKAGGGGAAGGRTRLRSVFVAGQISLTLLLLVTAGLLTRSLQSALAVDPGIDAEDVMVAGLRLDPHGYDRERGALLLGQLRERLEAHPDVRSVGLSQILPLGFDQLVYGVEIPGVEPPEGRSTFSIDFNVVDGGYFETVRLPIVQGRAFGEVDRPDAPGVAIINETMARRFWPGGDALGSAIRVGGVDREIVGVARDAKYRSLHEEPFPFLYLPHSQSSGGSVTVLVRSAAGFGAVTALVRRELRGLDANVPLGNPAPLRDRITLALLPQRIGAALIGAFGLLGLLLAAVGLYGTLAYSVGRRTREIGVRLALGARTGDVRAMVVRQGLVMVLAGLAVGLALAAGATRVLSGLLLEISPTDPVAYLGAAAVLAAVAFLACYLPARKATKVDPMVALRAD